ncbi:lipoprotein [Streptomyces sp. NBC_01142]|uniref:lipoprotein n=1 Tax=Streptomyces sp. NBC_01142 TaxID=2975865 RepID=UPI00225AB13D|nr:lipoprotein [Streptomyces sp. NBC_01142]MCX4818413.1 lipoprotein [Streptomyces sp. NBC_01142]
MVRGLVRGVGAGLVPAALVVGMLTGCSKPEPRTLPVVDAESGQSAKGEKGAKGEKSAGEGAAKTAKKAGTVGGSGSPCVLPVTFDLAADWKPEAMKNNDTFGALTAGPVTLVCEIDAKPAGNIGFLRVWTGTSGGDDTRKALEAFVADESKDRDKVEYTETEAGDFSATEVSYLNTNEFLDEPKKERALAVTTPRGVVVLHLGGFDTEEHEEMLPAYELAKKSLRKA